MGCEGYSSDFLADTAVSVGMPASFPQDGYINVVSCLGSKGFENKEAGRIGSFELLNEFTDIDKFIKDKNGVGMEEVQLKFLEEQDDFPRLSPLRDDCKGTFSCNGSRGSMDLMPTVSRNDNTCENSYLASSRLSVGGPLEEDNTLMEVDENLVNQVGGFNCLHLSNDPMVALGVSDGVWMEGKNESLLGAQSHMLNFESYVENVTRMVDRRKENDQENGRRMPFHYVRKQKEADKCNTLASLDEIGMCEQEVADEETFRIPDVDFESCNRVKQSSNKSAYCSLLQKHVSVKPSHSSTSFACYSGSIADPDIGASTSHVFKRSSIYCSKDDHCHGEAVKLAGVIARASKITVVRRANPKRAASLKSSLVDETSNQLIRIKTDGRKCRGKVSTSTSHTPTVIGIFGEVKRKKRNSHRCPRLSIWGSFDNLFGIIMQKNEHVKHGSKQNDTLKRRPRKPRSGTSRTNKTAILKSQGSQFSITKRPSPSALSVPPLFADAKIPLEDNINHSIPTSNGHSSAGTSYKKVEFEQNIAERCGSVFKSNTRERQLGEKDLESTLTQETSADNLLSEYHGVSSPIDVEFASVTVPCKKSFDPGNSPDSDVYNPHVDFDACTLDGPTSIKLEGVMDQNTPIQETKAESNLTSAALNFNKPYEDPFSALAKRTKMRQNLSKGKSKKGQQRKKKNEKRQKKENREKKLRIASQFSNCPSASSSHPSIAEKLEGSGRLEKDQRTTLSSACIVNDEEAPGDGGGKPKSGKKHSKGRFKSEISLVNSSVLGLADLDSFNHSFGAHNNTETRTNPLQNDSDGLLESILPFDDIQSCGGRQSVKTRVSKRTLSLACSLRRTRKLRCGQLKRNIQKSEKVLEIDAYPSENGLTVHPSGINHNLSSHGGQIHGETAMLDALLKDASNDVAISVPNKLSARERYNILLGQFSLSGKKAWALCDDCQKWRCVPDELVSIIEKSKWTCQDNVDEAFADCTVPQEKTDEAINRDLGILEEEDFSMAQHSYGEIALRRQSAAARPTWTLIKSNIFLHRSRRTQTIDEIMVCQCNIRPGVSCGEECLNRMLNIECVKGTCPCGDLCSNQQFQRRRYAKFKWIKCGKKGYGLQLEEDVLRGQFLIEYVGEVLDLAAYEARLKNYACRGQKHFYFMTLNGGEVIDACDKGNLGRFINHSCDPNCRTEKWMVNGEVCIGLFAIRDIKKGEEVTFDYNYVRVFGAAAKRCICGSTECRGYIGGDPSNSEVIVQDDSDGEDLEPVMIDETGENEFAVVEADSEAIEAKAVRRENVSVDGNDSQVNPVISDAMHGPSSKLNLNDGLVQSSVLLESMGSTCRVSEHQLFQDTQLALAEIEPDQTASEPLDDDTMPSISRSSSHGQLCGRSRHSMDTLHADQVVQTSVSADLTKFPSKTSDAVTSKKKLTTSLDEENSTSKSNIAMKSLHPVKVKRSMTTIRTVASVKAKKVSNTICNRHIEGVEEKLNELLDDDGGIRRQKDAAKGYLKLLVVTSAAGDENSGSISQSARDLSLILDAILKTKSRMVLVDIINKNGLQMLHKMLKQNNDNFNRIPILRKLLKVLEFLAEKQILSRDLINAAAPCSRMESFKESMLKLMKHRDSQIQVSARNFSNQWIPRTIRTMKPSDRDDPQLNIKRRGATKFKSCHEQGKWESDAIVCVNAANSFSTSPSEVDSFGVREAFPLPNQLMSCSASFANGHTEGTRIRKRKSRWDQPAEVDLGFSQASQCSGDQLVLDSIKKPFLRLGTISDAEVPRQTSSAWTERNNNSHEATAESIQHDVEDGEMPPGFESPCMDEHCTSSSAMGEVVIAHPQERYLPHLPISYGMPLLLMQQLGTPETEGSNEFGPSLEIAPAFPFKPFPPLPTYPRKDLNGTCGENSTINGCATRPQVKETVQQEKICTPSNERALCHRNGNGRRFSQWQRHWNNQRSQRCPPHWLQGGSAFRCEVGGRNRVRNLDSGNSRMDGGGGFNPSQGVNSAYFRSKFNQKDCYHN